MVLLIQLKSVVLSRIPKLRKTFTKMKRFATRDLGEYWFEKLLPDHFKPSAKFEFQHMPRKKDWLESKRIFGRGAGRVTDLIFSGKSRRFLMVGPTIKATSAGVSIRLTGPAYFKNPRYKTPGHPDKTKEVTDVSLRHRFLLSRRFESKLSGLVKRFLRTARPERIK